jgi:Helix-turn-helix domain
MRRTGPHERRARDRGLARRIAREEIARARTASSDHPWLTVEETAELLQTSPGAIRQRISTGWLAGDTVRDGKRRFIRREAVLRELEQKATGGRGL